MAMQKRGLFIGGLTLLILAAGGVGAAFLPDLLEKDTASESSSQAEEQEQAPSTYHSLLSQYYTAFVKNQPETLYKLMAPQAYWDFYFAQYSKTESDVIATYEQAIADTMADWRLQYGTDVTVSFAITGMSEHSDEFLQEWTEDMNAMIGEDAVHAEDAVTLQVERTLEGSEGTITETLFPSLIQVDGIWYILEENTQQTEQQGTT